MAATGIDNGSAMEWMEWKVHYFDRPAGQDGVSRSHSTSRARCETLATECARTVGLITSQAQVTSDDQFEIWDPGPGIAPQESFNMESTPMNRQRNDSNALTAHAGMAGDFQM